MAEQKINLLIGANVAGLENALKDVQGLVGELPNKTKPHFETMSSAIRKTTKDLEILATTQGATSDAFVDGMGKLQRLKTAQSEFNSVLQQGNTIGVPAATTMQRVGSSYNGLGMSINQLTREMPAFTNSMQTGFMAISNNIPMLVDELGRLKTANLELVASGQPAKSIFAQIGASLFSFQTVLSVGITLLTVYGADIVKFITNLGDTIPVLTATTKAIEENNKSLERTGKILSELVDKSMSGVELEKYKAESEYLKRRKDLLGEVNKLELDGQKGSFAWIWTWDLLTKNAKNYRKELEDIDKREAEKNKKGGAPSWQKFEFPETISSKIGQPFETMKDKMLELKQIGLDSFLTVQNQAGRFKEAMYALADEVGGALKQLAIDGFGQFAQMAGAALMGEDVDWGQAAAQMIGQIASTLGKGLIAMGIPLLFSPITAGEGALMIAGGGALMAVAGAFGTNKGSSRGSSGGSGAAPSSSYSSNSGSALSFKPMSTYIEVGGQVRGNNLKISLINTDISNRRVK